MAHKNRLKLYFFPSYSKSESWKNWLIFSVSLFSGIAAIATVLFMIYANEYSSVVRKNAKMILIFWTILPPIYFWAEYFLIWKTSAADSRPSFEEFKHGQEISRNIWLAFVAILTGLYFSRF